MTREERLLSQPIFYINSAYITKEKGENKMALIKAITPVKSKDIIQRLINSKAPQRYLHEGTYLPIKQSAKNEYFSPYASTGMKFDKLV